MGAVQAVGLKSFTMQDIESSDVPDELIPNQMVNFPENFPENIAAVCWKGVNNFVSKSSSCCYASSCIVAVCHHWCK